MDIKRFIDSSNMYQSPSDRTESYRDFDATQLYCPKCKQAVPVRKRLLLVLPDGDKYEYLCSYCSSTVGSKIDRNEKPLTIIG